jgi:hypothetical protein
MFACHLAFAGVAGLVSTVATAGPRYPDFNGDGKTDLYFLDDYSRLVHTIWLMDGTRVTDSRSYVAAYTWSLQDRLGDRNGDGKTDLVWLREQYVANPVPMWRRVESQTWLMNGFSYQAYDFPAGLVEVLSRDFNGDDKSDSLRVGYSPSSGYTWTVALMDGPNEITATTYPMNIFWQPWSSYHPDARTDFNGDGKADILWENDGQTALWLMDGTTVLDAKVLFPKTQPQWFVDTTGDFNGDGKTDLLWRSLSGDTQTVAIWLMDGTTPLAADVIFATTDWWLQTVADFDGDGKDDILWFNGKAGETAIWLMNGMSVKATAVFKPDGGPWYPSRTGDFNGDGKADIVWETTAGQQAVWLMDGLSVLDYAYLPNRP